MTMTGGGGQKSPSRGCTDLRSPHSGIFFVAADFQGSLSLTQSKFIRSFNGGAPLRASRTRIYFRGPRGGGQKFTRSKSGTGGQQHESFRRFRKIFFGGLGGGMSEVWSASSGTGVRPSDAMLRN
jgi:hypothetical protein